MKRKTVGILPNPRWLREHGYSGLVQAMRKYPQAFAHIQQLSKRGRTAEEWLPVAEQLMRNNDGVLPNPHWLYNHFNGLYQMMQKYPSLFDHIPQARKSRRTLAEWLREAKRLEMEQGVFPGTGWLRTHGYAGLDSAIQRNPMRFARIRRNLKRCSLDDRVGEAERLAARSNGSLPNMGWLRKNGYCGLETAMRKYSKAFAHIQRERRRSTEEWVPVAEQLATENKGRLPGAGWLIRHGYDGLYQAKRKCPELFAHLKP